jgi:hypothetical protein
MISQNSPWRKWCGALAFAAALMMGWTGTARAQFGEAAGIAELMNPEYLTRDITLFDKGLGLDETQRVIIEAFFNDYQEAFAAGMEHMKKNYDDMRPQLVGNDIPRVLALVFTPFEAWAKEREVIGDQFIDNVKTILTPEQMERWPTFERRLVREKEMSKGRLSGESTDLINIVRDLHLDEITLHAVQPVLDEYELALDQVLRKRREHTDQSRPEKLQAMATQDSQKGLRAYQEDIVLQIAVRSVNDQYLQSIAKALPEPVSTRFRKIALERSYPRVYRETPVERLFTAALELEGLTSDLKRAITELQTNYLAELSAMNDKLIVGVRAWEPLEAKQRAEAFAARAEGGAPARQEDPTHDDFLKRDELGNRYAKSLQAVLTTEQFNLLPGSFRWMADGEKSKTVATPVPAVPRQAPGVGAANPKLGGAAADSPDGARRRPQ